MPTPMDAHAPALVRNPVSAAGAVLTTVSAVAFIGYLAAESFGLLDNPYSGLIGFVAVPAVFVLGLLLIPLGIAREARRRRRGLAAWTWPAIDLGRSGTRRVMLAIGVLTLANLAIVSVAGLGAVHHMETDRFCGQTCHTPMRPEFTAHQTSSHANVGCVQCHVGPGPGGMVRAKLNGARQAYEFLLGTYSRPIPSGPARNIPMAAETCMRCHSVDYRVRDVTKTTYEYANDATNTETVTTLTHFTSKNHWHTTGGRRVEYVATDAKRGTIPYVRVTDANGQVTEYFAENVTAAPAGEVRRMDCLDCHSRPAHRFTASPEQAVDEALGAGEVDKSLSFLRREMVAALKAPATDEAAAIAGIDSRLRKFYTAPNVAPVAAVDKAIAVATRLYRASVYPDMKITWGTYVSQIGHAEADGCFRCHDDNHKSKSGRVINQECDSCHKEAK